MTLCLCAPSQSLKVGGMLHDGSCVSRAFRISLAEKAGAYILWIIHSVLSYCSKCSLAIIPVYVVASIVFDAKVAIVLVCFPFGSV